ncbi:MAG TPA: stalk domain-containing protein [Syntrophomonadaceae bacterium]|nr:stalk domain-containing protein [Syntrophomonadaceae bacterium]
MTGVNKNRILTGVGVLVVIWMLMNAYPVSATSIDLQPGSNEVVVDGNSLWVEEAPYIKEGRTMVPLDLISQAFQAPADTFYTDNGLQVRILFRNVTVFLQVGEQGAHFIKQFDQEAVTKMDVAPEIVDGRVFVPLCFIAQGWGAIVNWDDSTECITIQKE